MIPKLLSAIPYLVISLASLTGGFFAGSRQATKTAEAMIVPCICPPSSVIRLAPDFDVEKLNNKKGTFSYAPSSSFDHVTIVIDCQDSVMFKKLLQNAN